MEFPQPAGTIQGEHGHPQIQGSHIFNGGPNTPSPRAFEFSPYNMLSDSLTVPTAPYLHAAQPSPGAPSFPGGGGLAHQTQKNDWQTPFAAPHASNSHAGLNPRETLGVAAGIAAKNDAASGERDTMRMAMGELLRTIQEMTQMMMTMGALLRTIQEMTQTGYSSR
ncbi:hypothetical protein AAL_01459 [Moelleriella libera RCEF 2490]|uniref:Uncharacterized protein n=1 Tax=Moelleriella libera RCEF 2490 TaxID=1081109 RepID=A0A166U6P7_9HYPO|nr:hypothetical protein AAL_01459 [Moelleriella libera RCEF 2490]